MAVRPRDWLALATVPVVLLVVFLLPVERRESLRFVYQEPTLLTAYTAHFVHFEPNHLAANLLGYVLLAGGGYTLAALADRRRLFATSAATFLLAFPSVLSALNLAVPREAVGYGFSGINMAFSGLFGLVLVTYASRVDERIHVRHAPAVFFPSLALVSVVALPTSTVSLGIATVSSAAAAVYGYSAKAAWESASGPQLGELPRGWVDAGVLGAVAFLGYQFVGFPTPTTDGTVVNLYVHLLGFCLGFIVPYAAVSTRLFDDRGDTGFLTS